MRESNENGRFLASRPATSLTNPTTSQRLKAAASQSARRFFQGRRPILSNQPNCDAARDHRS